MQAIDSVEVQDYLLENDVTEPVTIKRNGHPLAVMIPYELYRAMHRDSRRVLRTVDLSEEDLEAILNSAPPDEHAKYDDELED